MSNSNQTEILNAIILAGGNPLMVGGSVRDEILGIPCKDIDIEVYGLNYEKLVEILSRYGKVSVVGQSFGVIKLQTSEGDYDFSLPRKDSKIGEGHKGFNVKVDSDLTPEEATLRRDFTINAISKTVDGKYIDPYGGRKDLLARRLRATSKHFTEDPLRVLRGMQFCGRFGLLADTETCDMCKSVFEEYNSLAKERVWEEWYKWATKSKANFCFLGLEFLTWTDWIYLYPELLYILDVNQDEVWHPEGDVFRHTQHVCNQAVKIADRENLQGEDRAVLVLAALCHDLGKAYPWNGGTTEFVDGRWRSHAHDTAGVPLAKSFLESIGCFPRIIDRVLPLVREHMVHCTYNSAQNVTPKIVKRLSVRLGKATINELVWLMEADHAGRPPLDPTIPDTVQAILDVAKTLGLTQKKPKAIIAGRHLIARGYEPSPLFGFVIEKCYEAQLDGSFEPENAELYLDSVLEQHKKDYDGQTQQ